MTDIHFQQMASSRSPCRCFKTRVLHFKVKNTPLKDRKWKEKVQKNAQLFFVKEGKLFIKKSSFEEFNLVFFTTERMVCFEIFRYILHSMAKTITFLKGNLCIFKCFIDVL